MSPQSNMHTEVRRNIVNSYHVMLCCNEGGWIPADVDPSISIKGGACLFVLVAHVDSRKSPPSLLLPTDKVEASVPAGEATDGIGRRAMELWCIVRISHQGYIPICTIPMLSGEEVTYSQLRAGDIDVQLNRPAAGD